MFIGLFIGQIVHKFWSRFSSQCGGNIYRENEISKLEVQHYFRLKYSSWTLIWAFYAMIWIPVNSLIFLAKTVCLPHNAVAATVNHCLRKRLFHHLSQLVLNINTIVQFCSAYHTYLAFEPTHSNPVTYSVMHICTWLRESLIFTVHLLHGYK